MAEDQNRRAEDSPRVVERVVALETNVIRILDAVDDQSITLREHIQEEGPIIRDHAVAMQRIASGLDNNTDMLNRIVGTLETMASHDTRVKALELWREEIDPTIKRSQFLWWLGVLIVGIVPGLWALLEHFKVI